MVKWSKIFKIETFWSTLMSKIMLLGVIGMCSINFMQKKFFLGGHAFWLTQNSWNAPNTIKYPKYCFIAILNKRILPSHHASPPLRHSFFHSFVIKIQRVRKQASFKIFCFMTSKLQALVKEEKSSSFQLWKVYWWVG